MKQWLRLVRFEFRKSYISPLMFGIVAAFLLINVISGWSAGQRDAYDGSERRKEQFWNLYEDYRGLITPEKVADLMEIYGPLETEFENGTLSNKEDPNSLIYSRKADYLFLTGYFVAEMRYDYLYQNYAYGVVEQARENLEFFAELGNDYEYKRNEKVIEMYYGRSVPEFTFTYFYREYLAYDTSILLVLLLCAFGMASVFVVEKETDMYMLLDTSANGGWKITSAKLMAAMGFAVMVSALFWVTDFVVFMLQSGSTEMLKMPLYALAKYGDTPLNLTMGEYALMRMGYRTLGVVSICLSFLLFSMLWKKALIPFFGNIGLALLFERIDTYSDGFYMIRCLNPMELLLGENLVKRYHFVSICGEPVHFYRVVIGVIMIEAVTLAFLLLWLNRRGRRSKKIRGRRVLSIPALVRKSVSVKREGKRERKPAAGMIGYECRKMLMYRKGAILIALYLILHVASLCISSEPYYATIEENKESYLAYMEEYGGFVTEETKERLAAEEERIDSAMFQKKKLAQAYFAGTVTEAEYIEQKAGLEKVIEKEKAFLALNEQFLYAKGKTDERYLLYPNGWIGLIADESPDYLLLILIVILTVSLFCEEYQCDMNSLLKTGKQTAGNLSRYKILASVVVLTLVCVGGILTEYLFHLLRYGLPNGDFPIQSLRAYSTTEKQLTLMQAFWLQSGMRVLGCVFAVIIVLFIPSCVQKYAPSLLIGLSVLVLPFLLVNDLQALVQFPGVWGYLSGTVYLAGKVAAYDSTIGARTTIFSEAGWFTIGWHTGVMIAVIAVLSYVMWRQNVNYWLLGRKNDGWKKK